MVVKTLSSPFGGQARTRVLVVGRLVGGTRVNTVHPAYFAKRELDGYLLRLSDADAELRARIAQLRRRPRKAGKPLWG